MSNSQGWFSEASYLRVVRGESRTIAAHLARVGLSTAALGYRAAVALRNARFNRDKQGALIQRAAVPVVSVGNLTLGGTGKTPMVEWIARWFRARGLRVVILSRGYGQDEGVNDEGRVLEENLPDVPHLQDKNRVELARIAVEELEADLLLLDDGFQHRRLARDLDIVLLDALDPFGQRRLFPRGLLREPLSALSRADLVVLSRADLISEAERKAIREEATRRGAPADRWIEARQAPFDLIETGNEGEQGPPIDSIRDLSVAAFCGIGNPEGFRKTVEPLVGRLLALRPYPDHHAYTADDVAELTRWARDLQADLVLTTQKDLVKLRASNLGAVPLRALRIVVEITSGQPRLEEALERLISQEGLTH